MILFPVFISSILSETRLKRKELFERMGFVFRLLWKLWVYVFPLSFFRSAYFGKYQLPWRVFFHVSLEGQSSLHFHSLVFLLGSFSGIFFFSFGQFLILTKTAHIFENPSPQKWNGFCCIVFLILSLLYWCFCRGNSCANKYPEWRMVSAFCLIFYESWRCTNFWTRFPEKSPRAWKYVW